jgi:hypothetical protein
MMLRSQLRVSFLRDCGPSSFLACRDGISFITPQSVLHSAYHPLSINTMIDVQTPTVSP